MCPINLETLGRRSARYSVSDSALNEVLNESLNSVKEYGLSFVNQRYIQKASELIEDMWTQIKKGELISESPIIHIAPKREPIATLRPLYNKSNELLLEIGDGKYQERFYLDRKYLKYFRYEKIVGTDYGCATVRYYDSRVNKDGDFAEYVNGRLNTYFSEVFRPTSNSKYFSKYFTKDEL